MSSHNLHGNGSGPGPGAGPGPLSGAVAGASGPQPVPGANAVGGYLWKKSPSGIRGFRKWQKRWFLINEKSINYWKEQDEYLAGTKPLGVIPLLQIIDAQYLPAKRIGCRLDIRVKNMRVYSLHGTDPDDAKRWTIAINEAMHRAKHWDSGPVRRLSAAADMQRTKLQKLLYKYKFDGGFNDAPPPPVGEETRRQTLMHQVWPTDAAVLKYLLHEIMDPKQGLFIYDLSDDSNCTRDSTEDQKEGEVAPTPRDPSSAPVAPMNDRVGSRAHDMAQRLSERRCAHSSCHAMTVGGLLYCPPHYTDRGGERATGQHHVDNSVLEMLKSKEFVRTVVEVFATNDELAHGYAVRVLWVLFRGTYPRKEAAQQFAQYVEIYCSGVKFNVPIKQALVAILLSTPQAVTQHVDKPIVVSFYMPVRHALTWPALFTCVKGCDFSSRISALQDVNTILHDNLDNGRSLVAVDNWQHWIFPIFCDLPKASENDELQQEVYLYLLSAFNNVHLQYFLKTEEFEQLINTTIYRLHQFGGSTTECMELGRVILASFCSKLTSQKNVWRKNDKSTNDWRNFTSLCAIIRKFVLMTAFWQTKNSAYLEEPGEPECPRPTAPDSARGHHARHASSGSPLGPVIREGGLDSARAQASSKKDVGSDRYMLSKNRVGKNDQSWYNEATITDYGIHWSEDGAASDIQLVSKLLTLFKAISLHEFNPALTPNMLPKERDYMLWAIKEYEFWQDTHGLLSMVTRQDIEIRKVMTYRKCSFLIQDFLQASSPQGRKTVLSELHSIKHSKISLGPASSATGDKSNLDFYDPVLGAAPMKLASPRHNPRALSGWQPSITPPSPGARKHQGSLSSGNLPNLSTLNISPTPMQVLHEGKHGNGHSSQPSSSPSSTSSSPSPSPSPPSSWIKQSSVPRLYSNMSSPSSSSSSSSSPMSPSLGDPFGPGHERDSLASNFTSHTSIPMHHSSSSSQHASSVTSSISTSTYSYMPMSGDSTPSFHSEQHHHGMPSFALPSRPPGVSSASTSSGGACSPPLSGIGMSSPGFSAQSPSLPYSAINTPLSPRSNHLLLSSPHFKGERERDRNHHNHNHNHHHNHNHTHNPNPTNSPPPPPPPGIPPPLPDAKSTSIFARTTSSPAAFNSRNTGSSPGGTSPRMPATSSSSSSSSSSSTSSSTRPLSVFPSPRGGANASPSPSPLGSGGYPLPQRGERSHERNQSPPPPPPPQAHTPSPPQRSKDILKKRIPPPPSSPPPGH